VAGLELAGHGHGGAQGQQAGLLHRPAAPPEVQGEAGLADSLAAAGLGVNHLADGAAE